MGKLCRDQRDSASVSGCTARRPGRQLGNVAAVVMRNCVATPEVCGKPSRAPGWPPPIQISDLAGDDAAHALRVDDAQTAVTQRELHAARLAARQMHALEADEGAVGAPGNVRMRGVELHDLVAIHRAGVGDVDGDGHRAVGAHAGARNTRIGVGEARVAEAIAERIKRLAFEISIGAVRHRIVAERGQIVDRPVERHRQASGRAEVARDQPRDGFAALAAGIPGFDDGRHMCVGPVHGERAAVHEHEHDGLADADDALEQALLGRGQIEAGAVPAQEAFGLRRAFPRPRCGATARRRTRQGRRPEPPPARRARPGRWACSRAGARRPARSAGTIRRGSDRCGRLRA